MAARRTGGRKPVAHLSVHLLKRGVRLENALREGASQQQVPVVVDGTRTGTLHIRRAQREKPKWFGLFDRAVQDPLNLGSRSVSAAYLTTAGDRTFAITFGHGHAMLQPSAFEERFGLRTTLNLVDPDRLRSIDRKVFEAVFRQGREQSTEPTKATNFGLNVETDLLRAVTGEPLDKKHGVRLSGADSLAVEVPTTLLELPALLRGYLAAFGSTEYQKRFDWIDHMAEVSDEAQRAHLDQTLVDRVRAGSFDRLWLAVPEIVDWSKTVGFAFTRRKNSPVQVDLHLRHLFDDRRDRAKTTLEDLKRWVAVAFSGDGDPTGDEWPVYRCVCFEIADGEHVFLLSDGKWYRIAKSYVAIVQEKFRSLLTDHGELPPFDADSEAAYNRSLSGASFRLIDRTIVRVGGDPIEPCDLYGADGRLVFVKRYSNSKPMSHLFGQALVAGEALKSEESCRKQMKTLVGRFPLEVRGFKAEDHPIVLGIVSWATKFDLPFFSKVTLRSAATRLQNYGYMVRVVPILDERSRRERGEG